MFSLEVNKGSVQDMVSFLLHHPRYNTAGEWNNYTSYAHCVKLHALDLPADIVDAAYKMLNTTLYWVLLRYSIREWSDSWDNRWAIEFNGKHDGWLVLYQAEPTSGPFTRIFAHRSVDQGEDFLDWAEEDVEDRVAVVQSFDEFCDKARDDFIDFCREYWIDEQEVTSTEKKLVAVRHKR